MAAAETSRRPTPADGRVDGLGASLRPSQKAPALPPVAVLHRSLARRGCGGGCRVSDLL